MQKNKITALQKSIGWLGAICLVLAYALLTFEFAQQKGLLFNGLQFIGGVSLAYRVYLDKNWSNLALEFFFVAVAVYAVVQALLAS
ncbi:MAG: CBU_0592 family membrane protein [Patescibacteria group bacterium]